MKNMLVACVALALAGCASAPKARMEGGTLVVDSPFDLKLGSTEYAKMLGDSLRTSSHVSKRKGGVTTNFYCFGTAKLAKPYFGFDELSLSFKGDDRKLDSVRLGTKVYAKPVMSFSECRDAVKKMAEDFKSQAGVLMRSCKSETDEAALASLEREGKRMVEDAKRNNYKIGGFAIPFKTMIGSLYCPQSKDANGDFGDYIRVDYHIYGMINDDKKCNVDASIDIFHDPEVYGLRTGEIPVFTNSTSRAERLLPKLPMTDKQKKAHDEAAKLREALQRLFGVDFDKPEQTVGIPIGNVADLNDEKFLKKEWTAMEKPFGGMDERRIVQDVSLFSIPMGTFLLRHAYDGDAPEEVREALAKGFLEALEKELGAKIEAMAVKGDVAERLKPKDGVPTFGDTAEIFPHGLKTHFLGRTGDIMVEIQSVPPRYALKDGRYEVSYKGAVIARFVQSSLLP